MIPLLTGEMASGMGPLGWLADVAVSAKRAEEQRDWQEHMASTAHQREVADLALAGLNPILSARFGGGASAPTGGVGAMPSSAVSALRQEAEIENVKADTRLKEAERSLANLRGNTETMEYQRRGWEKEILRADYEGHRVESELDKSEFGQAMRLMNRVWPWSARSLPGPRGIPR